MFSFPGLSRGFRGYKHLGHLSLLSQIYKRGAGAELEQLGPELTLDAAITSGGLTHCATTLSFWVTRLDIFL